MAIKRIQIDGTNIDVNDARIAAIDEELSTESVNPVQNAPVATKLSQLSALIGNLSTLVESLDAAVEALESNEAVIAWDGASVPVVANIPEGVVVEYEGTSYTGTLAAGTSTAGKTYFVGEEGSDTKTRYISAQSNGNYIWIDYGSTDIDLADYMRKDDNLWLTEEEFDAITVKDPTKTYNVYEEVEEI